MEFAYHSGVSSVPTLAEELCTYAGLELQSEMCRSTIPDWVQGALDRRDYEVRCREVALALATQVLSCITSHHIASPISLSLLWVSASRPSQLSRRTVPVLPPQVAPSPLSRR